MLILRLFMCNGNPSLAVLPQLTQWSSSFLGCVFLCGVAFFRSSSRSLLLGCNQVWRDRFTRSFYLF